MTISLTRICLGGLLAASLAGCGDKPAAQEETRPVRTTRVAATDTADIQRYTAEIRPRHESKQSFRVPGKIDARLVEVGQQVGAGAPLVRLDPADIGLELAAKRAQLAAAEAQLKSAERQAAPRQGEFRRTGSEAPTPGRQVMLDTVMKSNPQLTKAVKDASRRAAQAESRLAATSPNGNASPSRSRTRGRRMRGN